jgi:hypothetical protein
MDRIITLSLAALMTSVIVLSPEAKAQQTNSATGHSPQSTNSHDARTGGWPIPRTPGTNHDPELEARAAARFGTGISQSGDREQWMAEQEQRAIENEINRSKALVYPVGGR